MRRHDSHKKLKLRKSSYRKPRGLQSKQRLKRRGYATGVARGAGSPAATRGLAKGLVPVVVANASELASLDAKTHGVIISRTLGGRMREALLGAAQGFTILNADAEKALAAIKERLAERKKAKSARAAQTKKTLEKKAEKPKSEEEKKEEQEAEKHAVLTKGE